MIVSGTVVGIELGLALQLIGRAKITGIVRITSAEREATLVLAEGSVLHASSTTATKLGESLIARGVITAEVLRDALALQHRKKVKQPLGTILLELGVVTKAVAEAEIETQITRVLRDVFGWRDSSLQIEAIEVETERVLAPEACELEAVLSRLVWAPSRT